MEKSKNDQTTRESLIAMQELIDERNTENLLRNNTIPFKHKGKDYRLRQPEFEDNEKITKEYRRKKLELLEDETVLEKKEWVKIWKKREVDLEKVEHDMDNLYADIRQKLIKMTPITDKRTLDAIKAEIKEIESQIADKSRILTDHLSDSLEYLLKVFESEYTAFIILEVKEDEKWTKAFKSFKEFSECKDNGLLVKVYGYLDALMYGVKNEAQGNS